MQKQINLIIYIFLILSLANCGYKVTNLSFLDKVDKKYVNQTDDIAYLVNKPVKDLNFSQAIVAKAYYHDINDLEMVSKSGERILAIGGDIDIIRNTIFELAQVNLELKNYEKSQKYAHDYISFYPGSPQAKLASFINIKANFLASNSFEKDQEKTKKTIELAGNFEKKFPEDKEFASEINSIKNACYSKLLENELYIAQTYLNRFNYDNSQKAIAAAEKRLAYIKDKLLPKLLSNAAPITEFELALNKAKEKSITNLKA